MSGVALAGLSNCSMYALQGYEPPCDERRPPKRRIPNVWSDYTFYVRYGVQIWSSCVAGRMTYSIKAPNTHDFERILDAIQSGEKSSKLHILTKNMANYALIRDISITDYSGHNNMIHMDIQDLYPSYVINRKTRLNLPDDMADLIFED